MVCSKVMRAREEFFCADIKVISQFCCRLLKWRIDFNIILLVFSVLLIAALSLAFTHEHLYARPDYVYITNARSYNCKRNGFIERLANGHVNTPLTCTTTI